MNRWGIIGLGFIVQKHLDAIKDTGGELILACDIDIAKAQKVPGVSFVSNYHEMLVHPSWKDVEWLAICTPNYLHYPMILSAREHGKKVLCEKPLVLSSKQINDLDDNVFTVLQLRYNEEIQKLKTEIRDDLWNDDGLGDGVFYEGELIMSVHRDDFYFQGWKGDAQKSGDLLFNIGIHYIDLLYNIFDDPHAKLHIDTKTEKTIQGTFSIDYIADIAWCISIEAPKDNQIRRLKIGNKVISLDRHFENLHTKVYEETLQGRGITAREAGHAIKLIERALCEYK